MPEIIPYKAAYGFQFFRENVRRSGFSVRICRWSKFHAQKPEGVPGKTQPDRADTTWYPNGGCGIFKGAAADGLSDNGHFGELKIFAGVHDSSPEDRIYVLKKR